LFIPVNPKVGGNFVRNSNKKETRKNKKI